MPICLVKVVDTGLKSAKPACMNFYKCETLNQEISAVALGCMNFAAHWQQPQRTRAELLAEARLALEAALAEGVNFFDHADIYGQGGSEEIFAGALRDLPVTRESLIIQSKCGIRFANDPVPGAPARFDFSKEHIVRSVEGSLKRLGTDYLDVLLLHRPDPLMEPEEVATAFDTLQASGKVRAFGVSNHTPGQIETLLRAIRCPLVANQVQFSLGHSLLLDEGQAFNNRLDPEHALASMGVSLDAVDFCRQRSIRLQAWSPLDKGRYATAARGGSHEQDWQTATLITEIAQQMAVPAETVQVAWILRHPVGIQPIIGSKNPARIRAACRATDHPLSREDWYRLWVSARGCRLP